MSESNGGPRWNRETLLGRVSDILRRSCVEDAEEIVRELERRIRRDSKPKREVTPRAITESDVRAAARWDAMGTLRALLLSRTCRSTRQRMSDSLDAMNLAFALSTEGHALRDAMKHAKDGTAAYHACAQNFNGLLQGASDVLRHDPVIANTIRHLKEYADLDEGLHQEHERMKIDLAVLVGALDSFIALHMPMEERKRIGFTGKGSPKRPKKRSRR